MLCLTASVICNAQNNNLGAINGIVEGYPRFDANLLLSKFEKINPKTGNGIDEIFADFNKKHGQKLPLSRVKVFLKGKNIQRVTQTDNKGNFSFDNLPYGKYLVKVNVPNWIGVYTNVKMVATESKFIVVMGKNPKYVILTPDVLHVDVYGKVISENKQPVIGAKVIATWIYPQQFLEAGGIPAWDAITDKNGNYEFKGLPPSNWLRVAGALLSKQRSYDGVEIKVITKSGAKSLPLKLPLISQDTLYLAKRFSKIIKNTIKPSGIKYPQDTAAFIKSLPKSKGNDIFVTDIIVESK